MNTRNEEHQLPGLFSSAREVDEIIVADMESTDGTVDVARRWGATVLLLPNAGYCEPGRQPALEAASGEWLLVLDADERLSPGGVERLRELAAGAGPAIGAFKLVRRTFIGAARVQRSGWDPCFECHPRFFRRGAVRWPPRIHVSPEVQGSTIEADQVWIDHNNFIDLAGFVAKVNAYSTVEAAELLEAGRTPTMLEGLREGLAELVRRYTPAEDGSLSFGLAFGILAYRVMVHLKAAERLGWPTEEIPTAEALARAARAFEEVLRAELAPARPGGAPEGAPAAATATVGGANGSGSPARVVPPPETIDLSRIPRTRWLRRAVAWGLCAAAKRLAS